MRDEKVRKSYRTADSRKGGYSYRDQSKDKRRRFTRTKRTSRRTPRRSALPTKRAAADRRAGDAMNKANQVDQKTDRTAAKIVAFRGIVANLDDYKPVSERLLFLLNRATLTKDDKAQLDMLAGSKPTSKGISSRSKDIRIRPALKIITSSSASAAPMPWFYTWRRQRILPSIRSAPSVWATRNPPILRKTRAARAKNRRVEIKVFSADPARSRRGSGRV